MCDIDMKIEVIVDGQVHLVDPGMTILNTLKSIGIEIPSLCGGKPERKVEPCGICLVRLEGCSPFQYSCSTIARQGMSICTRSDELQSARKANLQKIFEQHYSAKKCSECIWDSDCEIHGLADILNVIK